MNELFQRPANYWLRHADRHKQSGDLLRAAVLQRHAVRAETDSDAARMQYALTLHQLHCYEASNREAFCMLASHPHQQELYGLIGCNLLAMGLRREGLDALDLYFRAQIPAAMPWHDEACDLADAYAHLRPPRKRQARLNGLLSIAARRIAAGDTDGARRALDRAQQMNGRTPSARRELLYAAHGLRTFDAENCLKHLNAALQADPFHTATLASAAALLHQSGSHHVARMLLVRAAWLARTPSDEQLLCHTAAGMDMIFVAQAMLKRTLRRRPDRFPALYDLCVCLLRLGQLTKAARCIHLCREIDPDDIPSETLFAQVMAWQQEGIQPDALRKAAANVSFYGSCTERELASYAQPVREVLRDGPLMLADAVQQDERLRRRMLFLLTLPLEWPLVLLQLLARFLPQEPRERLLREVLMQHPSDSPAKRFAMSALHRTGAPAPYACWTNGRFMLIDPDRLYAPVPSFRQRYLTLFIRRLAKQCGSGCIPRALAVVSRMTPLQQTRLIGDRWKVWQLAMTMRWHALQALPPVSVPVQTLTPLRLKALKQALHIIHKADRF